MVRVRVPASTSNLGPGFDCLGLALELHLEVEAETLSHGLKIDVEGEGAAQLPRDATNLVHACAQRVLRRAGPPPGLRLHLRNRIPVGRGLGSSGAATVAGLLVGTLLADDAPPDPALLFDAAAEIEGHPDNVAPALFGGLVASARDGARLQAVALPFPPDVEVLLVLPDHEVSTAAARALLPHAVPLEDAVFDLQHLALLLGSLWRGEPARLRDAMRDRLHQPYRLPLVPGLAAALAALESDPACCGAALSGSGPTLLAFVRDAAPEAGAAALQALARHGVRAAVRRVSVAARGATWERA